jgi:hypothetical protein
MNSINKLGLL